MEPRRLVLGSRVAFTIWLRPHDFFICVTGPKGALRRALRATFRFRSVASGSGVAILIACALVRLVGRLGIPWDLGLATKKHLPIKFPRSESQAKKFSVKSWNFIGADFLITRWHQITIRITSFVSIRWY